jgi:hypothetical protein
MQFEAEIDENLRNVEGGTIKSIDLYAKQKQKLSVELARSITVYVVDKLCEYVEEFQQIVFEKFLGHSFATGMLPSYYSNISIVKNNQEVVENLRDGLNTHLVGQCHSKLVVAKDIVCTLATS